MVFLDVDLFDVDLVFLGTETVQLISDDDFCSAGQYLESILRTEYNVVGTQPQAVTIFGIS